MTKLFSIIAVAVLATTFVSCGPSAEEKAKAEELQKHMQDSISNALTSTLENAMNDATATPDSTTAAAAVATETPAATTEAHAH